MRMPRSFKRSVPVTPFRERVEAGRKPTPGLKPDETGDDRWEYLTFYDLRRTWATLLNGAEVDSLLVCDWGGWDDLETFLDHYRGSYAPDVQARERQNVEWL